jgi:hypothetical protein
LKARLEPKTTARLGRAATLGAALLLLMVLTQAAPGVEGFEHLAVGTFGLILAIGSGQCPFETAALGD